MTLSQADIDSLLGPQPADSVESLLDAPVTGEDISLALQDPTFKPSAADYAKYEEYAKTRQTDWLNTIAQSVDVAAGMIGGAISQGVQGAAANPLNYIEGAAQGTRQLYGLVAQSQDPASPLFKFKDLVAGTGTPESRYQQFLEARDFANTTARLERGEEGLFVPPELTNPEFVQGVSMILDPTLALPGIGEAFGAGKLATRAVGRGAQLAGRAVTGAVAPVERLVTGAERIAGEALSVSPEALRTTAATTGIAGALGIAPEAAALAAVPAAVRTTREVGEAITRAGENLLTQPSRIGPLEAIGAAPGANMRQRMLGVIGQYGGDAALDSSLRGLAGGIEGAAVGTVLGGLSGGEEGAAAGLGTGMVQGAAGALAARGIERLTGKAAREARAGDLGRFIDSQQDPTTKALFERVRDTHGVDAASALMDVEALTKGRFGDVDVLYRSNKDFSDQFGGSARGVQVVQAERPTIVINADIIGRGQGDTPLYTLGHELFHALEKSEQLSAGATEIKDALVGRWVQEGDVTRKLAEGALTDADIEDRFNQYRDKLAAGNAEAAADLARYDTINKKADYIASEIAAEHFARLIAGQQPDAMLKGFSGLTRQLMDAALTQNVSKAIANAAASIERTFGVKPTDSVLFPDLKQASPQLNAMLRDLVRARRKLDERILAEDAGPARTLKPQDVANPVAATQLVELGLAERMPDGSVRSLSDEEIRVREDKDTTTLKTILESLPGARVVDGEIQGRFSPQQLSAIEQSQAVSSRMKDKIRAVASAMDNGNSIFVNYGAATRRVKNRLTGKFSSKYSSGIRLSQREVLPYSFYLSKADNPVVKVIDLTKIRSGLERLTAPDGSIAGGLWDNVDGFMGDLAKYFTNLDAKENARRSSELFGADKARFLGDFVNEQEKGGRKFVRDLRLDRIGSTASMPFRARISEDAIQLSKLRWMPSERVGDRTVTNSEEGYRIISGAKHKLYGPDGKLLGIFDTQTQAERKADATQARLQPEVDQQQRPARDEGRQAAEAGRGDRALGRPEGREEGRQELGPVRQAGDVRFMPEGKSAGLAVLDNELTLDLPKRPKVLEIANAFQKLFGKAIEYRKAKPEENARLVNLLVQEIQRAVQLHPEAKGWYDENIKLTMDVMRELDPDLAKPENDFIFKVILAATSDGNKVGPQFQQTWKEYSNWKNTGKISGDFVSGDRIENIKANLKMFTEMVDAIGWEKTKDFFTRKGTVKELRKAVVDTFKWSKKDAQGIGSSERVDEVVPFAVVLGPKLGSFFNNLYGDFSSVTMDRWFMRTIGRLTGSQVAPLPRSKVREMRNNLRGAVARLTPSEFELLGIKRKDLKGTAVDATATTIANKFGSKELRIKSAELAATGQTALEETRKFANALKKGLNPLVEAPVDGTHRRWIRERIAEVQKDLRSRGIELENADLQAVLWYLEKELYEKLNYRSKSGESDYASAASSVYRDVAGRPSDVYARGTGRVRAIGGDGRGMGVGEAQGGRAPREVGASAAEAVAARYLPAGGAEENIGGRLSVGRFGVDPAVRGSDFAEAIRRTKVDHPFGFAVDDKGTEFYTNPSTKLFLSEDGLAGVAVTDYGDLVSVFKHPQSSADIKPLLAEAANRSQTLDAFDVNGFLPNLYGNLGFRPVARVRFNREFAPPGWRYDLAGEPDVVLMVRDLAGVSGAPQITGKNYAEVKSKVPLVDYGTAEQLQKDAKKRISDASKENARFMPDYSGEHRAPGRDSGAPLDNLKGVYPDDVYGPNAARYYGHESGSQTDKAAVRIIQAIKGKPDAPVKVFRAIPKSIQSNEINPGDWITTIKSYAVQHGEGPLGGDYKILEKTVPAGDLYTDGNSIFEFGYDPKFMPQPDSAMPGAYSFPGGYRALPGKAKGSLRLYGPAGSLIGIAASLDEAQRIIRRKTRP